MPLIPAFMRLKKDDCCEFETTLVYKGRFQDSSYFYTKKFFHEFPSQKNTDIFLI